MIISRINTLINKLIDRNSYRNISFTYLLRKKFIILLLRKYSKTNRYNLQTLRIIGNIALNTLILEKN